MKFSWRGCRNPFKRISRGGKRKLLSYPTKEEVEKYARRREAKQQEQ